METIRQDLEYKGKKYPVVFNMNVMRTIQKKYGTVDEWAKITDADTDAGEEPDFEAILFGFTEMINEGIDIDNEENGTDTKPLTEKQVGRILTEMGLEKAAKAMNKVVVDSVDTGEPSKNE